MDTVKQSTAILSGGFFVAEKNSRKILSTRCCVGEKENTRKIFSSKNKNKKHIMNIEKENEQAKCACRTQL